MHSTTVSKKLLGLGPVVAVRFRQRQIAVFLWTEPAPSAKRGESFIRTKFDFREESHTQFFPVHAAAHWAFQWDRIVPWQTHCSL